MRAPACERDGVKLFLFIPRYLLPALSSERERDREMWINNEETRGKRDQVICLNYPSRQADFYVYLLRQRPSPLGAERLLFQSLHRVHARSCFLHES